MARIVGALLYFVVGGVIVAAALPSPVLAQKKPLSQSERTKILDSQFKSVDQKRNEIDRLISESSSDIEIPDLTIPALKIQLNDPIAQMENLTCKADAVILGQAINSRTRLTSDGNSVYTVWTVQIGDVLKAGSKQPVRATSSVEVLVRGGTLVRAQRRVVVRNNEVEGISPARNYLMFLHAVPETGAFVLGHIVDVTEEQASSLSKTKHEDQPRRSATLISDARKGAELSGKSPNCNGGVF